MKLTPLTTSWPLKIRQIRRRGYAAICFRLGMRIELWIALRKPVSGRPSLPQIRALAFSYLNGQTSRADLARSMSNFAARDVLKFINDAYMFMYVHRETHEPKPWMFDLLRRMQTSLPMRYQNRIVDFYDLENYSPDSP